MSHYAFWQALLDIGWFFLLLLLLGHFSRERRELVKAQSWLITKGHITHCEWTSIGHSVWPDIEYTYHVHSQELKGKYLFLDTRHNNPNSRYARNMAYQVAIAFKENKAINVYYNPNQPEQSALDVTIPKKLNVIICLLGIFLITHLGLMAFRYSHSYHLFYTHKVVSLQQIAN